MTPLLLALPWVGVLLFVVFVARVPSELPEGIKEKGAHPAVSVIVPARNEALNIETCLRSLVDSDYPNFEVIVVDDRSEDATAAIARAVPVGRATRISVIDGEELPDGWLGKPWACQQGARVATGDVLLFTDADTTHGTRLLGRAVAAMQDEGADLLTIVGRQLMETFWERLVQPHVFMMMLTRFPDFERTARNGRWRDAIANGQFMLFPRSSYEAIGGHEVVRDEVVEDLALAQQIKRRGLQLRIRSAEGDFATRMYRSLGELVEGWSKNLATGGLQSMPRLVRPFVLPASLLGGLGLWVAPPAALVASLAGVFPTGVFVWSSITCACSATTYAFFTHKIGAPWFYGLLYPLGACVSMSILLRSSIRGRRVEWKGRRYTLSSVSEREER